MGVCALGIWCDEVDDEDNDEGDDKSDDELRGVSQ